MSYIRATTNPESLYVWGDGKTIHWHWNVKPPLSNASEMTIPPAVLRDAALRWEDRGGFELSHRGLKIVEQHVFLRTGKPIVGIPPQKWMGRPTGFLVRLEYKGTFLFMWPVTWEYIVHGIVQRFRRKKVDMRRTAR